MTRRRGVVGWLAITLAVAVGVIGCGISRPNTQGLGSASGSRSCSLGCESAGRSLLRDQVYHSDQFGFEFEYPATWTVATRDPELVLRTGDQSVIAFHAERSDRPLDVLIGSALTQNLSGYSLKNVSRAGSIVGARIGDVDGQGERDTGTLAYPDGHEAAVSIGVVGARRNGLSVLVAGGDVAPPPTLDPDTGRRGPPEPLTDSEAFDYLLTTFRWPGET